MPSLQLFVFCSIIIHGSISLDIKEPFSCDGTITTLRQVAKQEAKISLLEEKIANLEAAFTGAMADSKCPYTAFRAQLTKDLGTVQQGQTIIYDNVELNIGNAYHPYHGVFTAPCNGVYLFSITIGNINRSGSLHLKKNNITVEYAYAGNNAKWDMGGVATVVELVAGDDVWVAGKGTITGGIGNDGIGDVKNTAFAGSLLHAF